MGKLVISQAQTLSPVWKRFVRFVAEDGEEYCGEPEDETIDIGLAVAGQRIVRVSVLNATSALDNLARFTGEVKTIKHLLSPLSVADTGAIRCVGLNYKDHAAELNLALPKTPEIFIKPENTLHGPTDPIVVPYRIANELDAEVELAVVIGRACRNVSVDEALDYVLGYSVANDVTARDFQKKNLQWSYCKGFDSFCPMGPALVSAQSLGDVSKLSVKTTLNGKIMQEQRVSDMIFSVAEIVSYLSTGTTLAPGTVILTGTPAGIGASHNPPRYLKEGDDLRVYISHGLGTLTNSIVVV